MVIGPLCVLPSPLQSGGVDRFYPEKNPQITILTHKVLSEEDEIQWPFRSLGRIGNGAGSSGTHLA